MPRASRFPARTLRRVALLLGLCWSGTGCVPVVTHGPRVEPGLWTGSTGSLRLGHLFDAEVPTSLGTYAVRPPNGFFARYGWAGGQGTPSGVSVGVHLPFAIPFSLVHPEVDVYAQLTSSESIVDAGTGVLASPSYLMPYAQLGGGDGRSAWYTTQGVGIFGYRGQGPDALLWMPAVVWKRERKPEPDEADAPRSAKHYYVQAALGREWVRDETEEYSRDTAFLILGITTTAPGWFKLPRFSDLFPPPS